MPPNIRNEEFHRLPDEPASTVEVCTTEAVRQTLVHDREGKERSAPLAERLRPLLDEIAAAPKTGLMADAAFYDDLSGNP